MIRLLALALAVGVVPPSLVLGGVPPGTPAGKVCSQGDLYLPYFSGAPLRKFSSAAAASAPFIALAPVGQTWAHDYAGLPPVVPLCDYVSDAGTYYPTVAGKPWFCMHGDGGMLTNSVVPLVDYAGATGGKPVRVPDVVSVVCPNGPDCGPVAGIHSGKSLSLTAAAMGGWFQDAGAPAHGGDGTGKPSVGPFTACWWGRFSDVNQAATPIMGLASVIPVFNTGGSSTSWWLQVKLNAGSQMVPFFGVENAACNGFKEVVGTRELYNTATYVLCGRYGSDGIPHVYVNGTETGTPPVAQSGVCSALGEYYTIGGSCGSGTGFCGTFTPSNWFITHGAFYTMKDIGAAEITALSHAVLAHPYILVDGDAGSVIPGHQERFVSCSSASPDLCLNSSGTGGSYIDFNECCVSNYGLRQSTSWSANTLTNRPNNRMNSPTQYPAAGGPGLPTLTQNGNAWSIEGTKLAEIVAYPATTTAQGAYVFAGTNCPTSSAAISAGITARGIPPDGGPWGSYDMCLPDSVNVLSVGASALCALCYYDGGAPTPCKVENALGGWLGSSSTTARIYVGHLGTVNTGPSGTYPSAGTGRSYPAQTIEFGAASCVSGPVLTSWRTAQGTTYTSAGDPASYTGTGTPFTAARIVSVAIPDAGPDGVQCMAGAVKNAHVGPNSVYLRTFGAGAQYVLDGGTLLAEVGWTNGRRLQPRFYAPTYDRLLFSNYHLDNDVKDSLGFRNGTNANVTYAAGKLGLAAVYNGSSSSTTMTLTYLDTSMTVTAWVNTTNAGAGGGATPIQNPAYGSSTCYTTMGVDNGKAFYMAYEGGYKKLIGPTVNDGNWHFLAVTHTGTTARLYSDGVEVADGGITYPSPSQSGYGLIGKCSSGQWFNGSIDEVTFYNAALTPADIAYLYNAGAGRTYPFSTTTTASWSTYDGTNALSYVANFSGTKYTGGGSPGITDAGDAVERWVVTADGTNGKICRNGVCEDGGQTFSGTTVAGADGTIYFGGASDGGDYGANGWVNNFILDRTTTSTLCQ